MSREYLTGENHPRWLGDKIKYVCPICGKEFRAYHKDAKYCSVDCKSKSQRKGKRTLTCDNCGKTYKVYPSVVKWNKLRGRKNNFCSRKCQSEFRAGKPTGEGRYVNERGYVLVLDPGHPRPVAGHYIYEHRAVMEKHSGRILREDEHIHHIDGDRQNNSVENLRIISPSEHAAIHDRDRERDRVGRFK